MFTSKIKSRVFLSASCRACLTHSCFPEPKGVRIQALTGGGDQTEPADSRSLTGASSRRWRLMELFAFCLVFFLVCFCHATGHQQPLNVLPGKRAAAVVPDAGAHRHLCAALGTGQAEELIFRPERAARKVSLDLSELKGEGKREWKSTVKLFCVFPNRETEDLRKMLAECQSYSSQIQILQ